MAEKPVTSRKLSSEHRYWSLAERLMGSSQGLSLTGAFCIPAINENKMKTFKQSKYSQLNNGVKYRSLFYHISFIIIGILVGVILIDQYKAKSNFKDIFQQSNTNFRSNLIQSTVIPSISPTIQLRQNTNYIQPTTDSDPPVHCKIHPECGGGTMPLRQSECNNSICCQMPDGKSVFYKDKNKCNQDQGGSNPILPIQQQINTKTNIFVPGYNFTVPCWEKNSSTAKDIANRIGQEMDNSSSNYQKCLKENSNSSIIDKVGDLCRLQTDYKIQVDFLWGQLKSLCGFE